MFTKVKEYIRQRRIDAIVKAYKNLLKATTKVPEYTWKFNICISSDNKLIDERETILDRMISGNEKYGFNSTK